MKKVKKELIHLLGGVTNEENNNIILKTKKDMLIYILNIMKFNYGKSADEWCKIIYNKTKERYDMLHDVI